MRSTTRSMASHRPPAADQLRVLVLQGRSGGQEPLGERVQRARLLAQRALELGVGLLEALVDALVVLHQAHALERQGGLVGEDLEQLLGGLVELAAGEAVVDVQASGHVLADAHRDAQDAAQLEVGDRGPRLERLVVDRVVGAEGDPALEHLGRDRVAHLVQPLAHVLAVEAARRDDLPGGPVAFLLRPGGALDQEPALGPGELDGRVQDPVGERLRPGRPGHLLVELEDPEQGGPGLVVGLCLRGAALEEPEQGVG